MTDKKKEAEQETEAKVKHKKWMIDNTVPFLQQLKQHREEKTMSSHSYETKCPNCSKEMNSCQENRPIDYITSECIHCGFYLVARSGFMSLEDLNESYN